MDKNDILKICQSAGYPEETLIYGGLSMENIMCPMDRMTLRNSKMWVRQSF